MKSSAKKAAGPLIAKKLPGQAFSKQDTKFRSTFVEGMKSNSPPPPEGIKLPEALIVPGVSPPIPPALKVGAKPVAKSGAKIGAKTSAKPETKALAKPAAKVSAKKGAKTPAKTGNNPGKAKVGALIIKKPEISDSLTSRRNDHISINEEEKSLTERLVVHEKTEEKVEILKEKTHYIGIDQSVQDGDFKEYLLNQGLNDKRIVFESVNCESLNIVSKPATQIKVLQTLSFKRIVKPIPDFYFCESFKTCYSFHSKPLSCLSLSNMAVQKYESLQKPISSFLFTQQVAYKAVTKPNPIICYSELELTKYSVIEKPLRNIYYQDTNSQFYDVLNKPLVNIFLYIPAENLPIAPCIEVIEEYDLKTGKIKVIQTITEKYQIFHKPNNEFFCAEERFTSKFPVLKPSVKLRQGLQIEQED